MNRVAIAAVVIVAACRNAPHDSPDAATSRGASHPPAEAPIASTARPASSASVPSALPTSRNAGAAGGATPFGEPSGSCNWIAVVSSCIEAVGTTPEAREAAFRALGQTCKSVPRRTPCPAEGRIGSCRTLDGFVDHYYATGPRPYTAVEAKAECENRDGRWLG